jgi:hypothetical protein
MNNAVAFPFKKMSGQPKDLFIVPSNPEAFCNDGIIILWKWNANLYIMGCDFFHWEK